MRGASGPTGKLNSDSGGKFYELAAATDTGGTSCCATEAVICDHYAQQCTTK